MQYNWTPPPHPPPERMQMKNSSIFANYNLENNYSFDIWNFNLNLFRSVAWLHYGMLLARLSVSKLNLFLYLFVEM